MADAYCGPSNALQSFKQHTSVDRTLQQDRIISRQQPGQAFRSLDPTAGALDADFEAFQAQQPSSFAGPLFPQFDHNQHLHHPQHIQHLHHPRHNQHLHHPQHPQLAGPSQAPAWATDFSNLHISQQHASQQTNTPWATQFQHTSAKSPAHLSQPLQHASHHMYPINRSLPSPFQQHPLLFQQHVQSRQSPLQFQHDQSSATARHIDDAAFDAAFDAAMQDAPDAILNASIPTAERELPYRAAGLDSCPEFPFLRLTLMNSILENTEESLYRASICLHHLDKYPTAEIHPIQAILMRPLITRLADTSRTHFGATYLGRDMEQLLQRLGDRFKSLESHAHITPDNEQLLAAYADCLWSPVDLDQQDVEQQPSPFAHLHDDDLDARARKTLNTYNLIRNGSEFEDLFTMEDSRELRDNMEHDQLSVAALEFWRPQSLHKVERMARLLDLELKAFNGHPLHDGTANLASLTPDDSMDALNALASSLKTSSYKLRDNPEGPIEDQRQQERRAFVSGWLGPATEYSRDLQNIRRERDDLMRARSEQDSRTQELELKRLSREEEECKARLNESLTESTDLWDALGKRHHMRLARARGETYAGHAHDLSFVEQDLDRLMKEERQEGLASLDKQEEQLDQTSKDDDELANTAAELLNKVSHDKSTKFQNSAFLGLMRKLADREVKVEGDKMVETKISSSSAGDGRASQPATGAAPSTWSSVGPSQAPFTTTTLPSENYHEFNTPMHPTDNYHDYNDGQEVVNLLNMPDEMELPSAADINNGNQDSAEFLMTSPFADAGDY